MNQNCFNDFIRRSPYVAIYYKDESITYDNLYDNVSRYANLLKKLFKDNDEIVIQLPDCPEYFYLFWGAIKVGIKPMLINTSITGDQFDEVINKKYNSFVFDINNIKDFDKSATDTTDEEPILKDKNDICFYLFSSGTTGYIKRIPHKHKDIAVTCNNYAKKTLLMNSYDICFSSAKLSFAYGLGNSMTFPLYVGASTILMSEDATAKNVFEIIRKYSPSIFFGVPTLYSYMCKTLETTEKNINSVRMFISAGEALPKPIYDSWIKHTNKPILDGIGTTEALHIFISNKHNDHELDCSGKLVPGYFAKVLDIDRKEVKDGEIGYLHIKGDSLFTDDWYDTGDMFIKNNNKFYYQGRSNDMIKVGGVWVSPNKIESKILEHNNVLEVGVVPSLTLDGLTKPKAYIVLKDNTDNIKTKHEIKRLCIKDLPKNHFPYYIEFVDRLPKTATGKIQRFHLRV